MYKTVYRKGESRLIEKKSEFIGRVAYAETKEAAEAFIAAIREKEKDATHNCTAYIIGEEGLIQKYDDDGEPQKTAGPPILEVLKRNDLRNVVCVVTRYFGGTLLGAGGLIRAYSTATSEALIDAKVVEMHEAVDITFRYAYTAHGTIENYMRERGYPLLDSAFSDQVQVTTTVYLSGKDAFESYLKDATSGEVDIIEEKETERPVYEGKLLVDDVAYEQFIYGGNDEARD
ncbi:YigZ family protein [Peptoniphilus sp. HCN-40583]|uniref:YigZ family protein n=1 Tax=Peptoniphilus sp. HCN-40583 TaxID=3134662 RepID=UPI0030C29A36